MYGANQIHIPVYPPNLVVRLLNKLVRNTVVNHAVKNTGCAIQRWIIKTRIVAIEYRFSGNRIRRCWVASRRGKIRRDGLCILLTASATTASNTLYAGATAPVTKKPFCGNINNFTSSCFTRFWLRRRFQVWILEQKQAAPHLVCMLRYLRWVYHGNQWYDHLHAR